MEEKFLKARQEREEQRQQRAKEGEEVVALRQEYEAEAEQLESHVAQLLKEDNVPGAQQRIDTLRKLVQDTANSIFLTAHDMAKANAILARLQQVVDDTKNSSSSTSIAAGGAKKFKFSSRLKTKATAPPVESSSPTAPTAAALPMSSTPSTPDIVAAAGAATAVTAMAESTNPGVGNAYGPFHSTDIFVSSSKSVFLNHCTDCTIYCLPIAGSVFLAGCRNCRVYVACHQLRCKDCHDVDVYVWCASTPIIESCKGMRFGPYTCWTGLLHSQTDDGRAFSTHAAWVRDVGEIADTARTERHYETIDDFQWIRKTASPHWRVLTKDEQRPSNTVFGTAAVPTNRA